MKTKLYPGLLRFWHWTNAIMFILLIITGISMHYSGDGSLIVPFDTSVAVHNVAGIILTLMYLFFFVYNIISKNYRQYIPESKNFVTNLFLQAKFYISGIFKNEPHPFEVSKKYKFNPLQRITYLGIMYVMTPLVVLSGLLLMFPEIAPDEFMGFTGLLPMAILHAAVGFFLTLFTIGHIYLATTGETVTANFKSMITGWHEEHNEPKYYKKAS